MGGKWQAAGNGRRVVGAREPRDHADRDNGTRISKREECADDQDIPCSAAARRGEKRHPQHARRRRSDPGAW